MEVRKAYDDLIKDKAKEMGFRKYKRTYFRVVNDIYQFFTLNMDIVSCSYTFSVVPLCQGEINWRDDGLFRIKDFYVPAYFGEDVTEYRGMGDDPYIKNDETITRAATAVTELMHKHAFPFFERANSTLTAPDEIKGLFELRQAYRNEWRRRNNIIAKGKAPAFSRTDFDIPFMDMKNGRYDSANEFVGGMMNTCNKVLSEESEIDPDGSMNLKYSFWLQMKEKWEPLFICLENNDVEGINAILAQNEAKSIETLKSYGWKFE